MILRLLERRDSFAELTDLLHRAYAPLAKAGFRYLASHQDVAMTRQRCAEGECWVAEADGRIIGTVTWRHGAEARDPAYYHRPGVAMFGQFAVDPSLQRGGVGGRLLARIESRAAESGFLELACDTAEGNRILVDFYLRRGFRAVDRHQWDGTNYESAVLTKVLARTSSQPSGSGAPSAAS